MIPPVSAWVPYLSAQVGHAPFASQDEYGAPTYGTTTWYPAHIEDAMVQTGSVNQIVTGRLHIIIGAIVAMDPRDRLLVPAPFTSRNSTGAFSTGEDAQSVRIALALAPMAGHHHTEVWTE